MSKRFVESNCPDNVVIRVWHFRGEDAHSMTGRGTWATRCSLFDVNDTEFVAPVVEAWSHCHEKDQPNRKIGRAIAVGRALKLFDGLSTRYSGDLDMIRQQFHYQYPSADDSVQ